MATAHVTTDFSNWMERLPTHVQQLPLRQLAIPGSHDSGAFYLDKDSSLAPDEGSVIKNLVKVFGSCAKNVVHKWSITQSESFTQQLQNGIRYLDMRTAYRKEKNDFYICHGLYGITLENAFTEIEAFIQKSTKEVLILDFNHLYSFTPDLHKRFVGLICERFGEKLYGPGKLGADASLTEIWSNGRQVIALYDNKDIVSSHPQLWSQSLIFSPWPNTASTSTLSSYLDNRFSDLRAGSFNVFQAILTPQNSTVFWHLASGSLKTTLATKCDKCVAQWLAKVDQEKKKGVNIVICDFIDQSKCVEGVLKLNSLL